MEDKTKSGSSFLKELEDRLDDIFSEEEKPKKAEAQAAAETSSLDMADAAIVPEEESRADIAGDSDKSSSIKDLKSVVLSLEWELNDEGLERFDEEILKVENIYAEDMFAMAFVRMLRFLGRYIRVKSAESEARAINLLLSTYDNLEKVLLSPMPESKKFSLMLENITSYREWVEGADLSNEEKGGEKEIPEQARPESKPALQVLTGGSEIPADGIAEEPQAEAPPLETSPVEAIQREGFPGEASPAEESSVRESSPDILQETEPEGEAAQWKRAEEGDSIPPARDIEAEPAFVKETEYVDHEQPVDVRPDETLAEETRPDGQSEDVRPVQLQTNDIAVDEMREFSDGQSEMQARKFSETEDVIAPDLERIRREIRDEIMQELRAEIDALREEIRYLSAKVNN